jgi:hypothetical protein
VALNSQFQDFVKTKIYDRDVIYPQTIPPILKDLIGNSAQLIDSLFVQSTSFESTSTKEVFSDKHQRFHSQAILKNIILSAYNIQDISYYLDSLLDKALSEMNQHPYLNNFKFTNAYFKDIIIDQSLSASLLFEGPLRNPGIYPDSINLDFINPLMFNPVLVGDSSFQNTYIRNYGNYFLMIDSLKFTDGFGGTWKNKLVLPGDQINLKMWFCMDSPGIYLGQAEIYSNANLEISIIHLGASVIEVLALDSDVENLFLAYPNPVREYLILEFESESLPDNIFVINITGESQNIKFIQNVDKEIILDFNLYSPGLYLVHLLQNGKSIGSKLIIKN